MTVEFPPNTTARTARSEARTVIDPQPRSGLVRTVTRAIGHGIDYALVRLTMAAFGMMSPEAAGARSARLMGAIGPRLSVHRKALRNLARAFPDRSEAERQRIMAGVWDSVGRTYGEYAHLGRFDFFGPNPRVEIIGMDTVERLIALNKGGLFLSGHFANWELMPRAMVAAGLPCATIVRPVNNALVQDYLDGIRRAHVCPDMIYKRSAMPRLVRALRAGKFVAMLVDQRMDEGISVPFFGQQALTNHAPALLALKLGCPLIPAWIERTGPARYALHVFEPLEIVPSGDVQADVLDITTRMNAFLEDRIRARPEQWMWLHNRWAGRKKVSR
ncbi:MAG: lysophospholipid acyltransferase family protein [Alphaproteobacteria bacterium]